MGFFCFLFFSLTSLISFMSVSAQMVPAVFVFGDSLVDVGNNNHLKISIAKANFPHNGVDFPGKKATGRFSNGKNAADFLAEKLGLPTSPPYLSINSKANKINADFLHGVSFASGGAGIFDGSDERYRQSIPLTKQVDYYTTVHEWLVRQLGVTGAKTHLAKSIFAFVIGSNDLFDYFGSSGSDRRKQYTPQQYVDLMVSSLKAQLKRTYDLGGRKYAVIGVGPIGCCPARRKENKTGECNDEANYWSRKYNDGLKSMLVGLTSEFKDLSYSYSDTYKVLQNVIQNPATYGFTEVKAACCGLGNLKAEVPCLPIADYCSNRKDHVFWDLYHPTEAVASLVVDNIFDGSKQYTLPINVRQLVSV